MKRFALITGGTVSTVVEQSSAPTIPGQWIECTGQRVGPGFEWAGGQFAPPPAPIFSKISTPAFWDRFTNSEVVDYDVAMQHDPSASVPAQKAAAKLRIFRREASDSGFVVLSRPRVASFVQGLEGTVLAPGRAAEILAAITEEESV